jgi:hypothetical protein
LSEIEPDGAFIKEIGAVTDFALSIDSETYIVKYTI